MPRLTLLVSLGRWAALGAVASVLSACVQPMVVRPATPSGATPQFLVTVDKPGDRVVLTADNGQLTADVWSESGIGGASFSLTAGALPQSISFRLHLRGLEQMTLAYADTVVSLSVPSGGNRPVLQVATVGGSEMPVASRSPYWMDVTRVESEAGAAGGYYQVTPPQAFFPAAATEFRITWIDFYR